MRPVVVQMHTRRDGTCRGCAAPIVWFVTKNDKHLPFNADVVAVPTPGLLDGEALFGTVESRYAHWATCPVAPAFRRPKR